MSALKNGYFNSPIFGLIGVAPDGHAFGSSPYSITIGERKMANVIQKGRVRADWIKRPFFDMLDTDIEVEIYENDWQTYLDWIYMSKTGLSNWQFTLPDGTFANYVKNIGSIGDPNGSWLMGTLPTYEVGDVERSIKIKAQGGGYRREWRWQNENGAIAYPGGVSGGAISGFAKLTYDITRVGAPGIVAITNSSGDSVPFLTTGTKVTLEPNATPSPTSPRHQPIINGINIKVEVETQDDDLAQTRDALESYVNDDQDWTIHLAPCENDITNALPDPTIVFHNSVFPNPDLEGKETSAFTTKFTLDGFCPLDSPAWAGNNFVFDLVANSLTCNRIGV